MTPLEEIAEIDVALRGYEAAISAITRLQRWSPARSAASKRRALMIEEICTNQRVLHIWREQAVRRLPPLPQEGGDPDGTQVDQETLEPA